MMLIYIAILLIAPSLAHCTTCKQIRELPFGKRPTFNDIKAMEPSEIVNCLSHLAREPMNIIEADYIWQVIVDLYEGVSNVPQKVLAELHWITPAIRLEDYANITIDTIEVVKNFGINYNLDLSHLAAIADRVREDFYGKTPEDYTNYDLKALTHILCGFNRTEIERIHPSAYRESAFLIGKLKNCNPEVMQGFATLAEHKNAFGPANNWSALIMKIVGQVAEHLPRAALEGLKMKKKADEETIAYLDEYDENDYRSIYVLENH